MRRIIGTALVLVGLVALLTAATGGNGGVPQWLVVRVHQLVVGQDQQSAEIAQLQSDVASLKTDVAALQSQAACTRPLPVALARVRAETGKTRMVLRLTAGSPPVYRLERLRAAC
jgi:cell division protein FtsB